MAEVWLSIIGIGEDGLEGLTDASRALLHAAEVVFGGPRHLELAGIDGRGYPWPVPFDIAPVLACRGRPTAALASGDPFWHGVGGSLAAHLSPAEWRALPAPSTFSLTAARLGWRLEETTCHGLHAAPFERLRPVLHRNARLICLLRDGKAPAALASWLTGIGFGASTLHVLEALGGPRERVRSCVANTFALTDIHAPVAVAIEAMGPGLPRSSGLPDEAFAHDGQITKRPIRAVTVSTLAPRPGEHLWDIGAGSGSISVEWCLAGGTANAIEIRPDRASNVRENANRFGLDHRLRVVEGTAIDSLDALPKPDAVFVGGGTDLGLIEALAVHASGARIVVNAVTLETEALLTRLHASHGGTLMKIDIASAEPLGGMRGWVPARPVVQWSGTL